MNGAIGAKVRVVVDVEGAPVVKLGMVVRAVGETFDVRVDGVVYETLTKSAEPAPGYWAPQVRS